MFVEIFISKLGSLIDTYYIDNDIMFSFVIFLRFEGTNCEDIIVPEGSSIIYRIEYTIVLFITELYISVSYSNVRKIITINLPERYVGTYCSISPESIKTSVNVVESVENVVNKRSLFFPFDNREIKACASGTSSWNDSSD